MFSTIKTKALALSSYTYTTEATTVNSNDTHVHNYRGFLSQRNLLHPKGTTTHAPKSYNEVRFHFSPPLLRTKNKTTATAPLKHCSRLLIFSKRCNERRSWFTIQGFLKDNFSTAQDSDPMSSADREWWAYNESLGAEPSMGVLERSPCWRLGGGQRKPQICRIIDIWQSH